MNVGMTCGSCRQYVVVAADEITGQPKENCPECGAYLGPGSGSRTHSTGWITRTPIDEDD